MMPILLCVLLLLAMHSLTIASIDQTAPKAVLSEQIFEFEPVIESTIITHDLILQNGETTPLVIHNIKTG